MFFKEFLAQEARILSSSCDNIKSLAFLVDNKNLTPFQTPTNSESAKLLEFLCDSRFSLELACDLLKSFRESSLECSNVLESLVLESPLSERRKLLRSYYQTIIEFYDQNRTTLLVRDFVLQVPIVLTRIDLINFPNLLNTSDFMILCLQKLPATSAFKPSVCKGETERQFLPLNLQIHRTIVYPPITLEKSECSTCGSRVCLDIVTVGGFVAHPLKYKRNFIFSFHFCSL